MPATATETMVTTPTARATPERHRPTRGPEPVGLGPVAVRQHVDHVGAAHAGRVVDRRLGEAALAQVAEALLGLEEHVLLRAEVDGAGGAGLDAGGLQPHRDAVGAECALVDLGVLLAHSRDV